jgi:hypothetical protein
MFALTRFSPYSPKPETAAQVTTAIATSNPIFLLINISPTPRKIHRRAATPARRHPGDEDYNAVMAE